MWLLIAFVMNGVFFSDERSIAAAQTAEYRKDQIFLEAPPVNQGRSVSESLVFGLLLVFFFNNSLL